MAINEGKRKPFVGSFVHDSADRRPAATGPVADNLHLAKCVFLSPRYFARPLRACRRPGGVTRLPAGSATPFNLICEAQA